MHLASTFFWAAALVAPVLSQIDLKTAKTYGCLASSGITNTGFTVITGDIGTTGSTITGFPPGLYTGTSQTGTSAVTQARADAAAAYDTAQGLLGGVDSTDNSALGGRTLLPGIYTYHSGVLLSGILTLNAAGNSSAIFVFQIASTLLVASSSSMVLINGANACNIYWAVGSSATLGTNSAFAGKILAYASISLTTGASNQGGLYAGAAITLQSNDVVVKSC